MTRVVRCLPPGGGEDKAASTHGSSRAAKFFLNSGSDCALLAAKSFEDYFDHLIDKFRPSSDELIVSLILIERMSAVLPLQSQSAHRLFGIVLIVALQMRRRRLEPRLIYERAALMKMDTIKAVRGSKGSAHGDTCGGKEQRNSRVSHGQGYFGL